MAFCRVPALRHRSSSTQSWVQRLYEALLTVQIHRLRWTLCLVHYDHRSLGCVTCASHCKSLLRWTPTISCLVTLCVEPVKNSVYKVHQCVAYSLWRALVDPGGDLKELYGAGVVNISFQTFD